MLAVFTASLEVLMILMSAYEKDRKDIEGLSIQSESMLTWMTLTTPELSLNVLSDVVKL